MSRLFRGERLDGVCGLGGIFFDIYLLICYNKMYFSTLNVFFETIMRGKPQFSL